MGARKSFIRLFHAKCRAVLSARPFLTHRQLIKLDEGSDYRPSIFILIKNKVNFYKRGREVLFYYRTLPWIFNFPREGHSTQLDGFRFA